MKLITAAFTLVWLIIGYAFRCDPLWCYTIVVLAVASIMHICFMWACAKSKECPMCGCQMDDNCFICERSNNEVEVEG